MRTLAVLLVFAQGALTQHHYDDYYYNHRTNESTWHHPQTSATGGGVPHCHVRPCMTRTHRRGGGVVSTFAMQTP